MMRPLQLSEVAGELNGRLVGGDYRFSRVSTDTRSLQTGDLFVALRGPRFDAHDYLHQAASAGAGAAVVEREMVDFALPALIVEDTTRALGDLARINRRLFAGPLIAITGSGGKTSVKNLLRSILEQCGGVHATQGNFNNHIGVPLTLFELNSQHQFAVIEMGASAIGEIAYLTDIARPTIAVVTNALHAHIQGFGSLDGVAKGKGEIFAGLGRDGIAVVNLDDAYAGAWLMQAGEHKKLTFAVNNSDADFTASDIAEQADGSIRFVLHMPGAEMAIRLPLLGRQNVANALAAAACAHAAGADARAIKTGLETVKAAPGRMERKTGVSGATLIDDSYNANPDSVKAAIDALQRASGEKILVLGDLAELGPDAEQFHRELGSYAKTAGVPRLVTVGQLAKVASDAFGDNAMHCTGHDEAADWLKQHMGADTVVLVKGSRSSRMDKVVAALTTSGEQ